MNDIKINDKRVLSLNKVIFKEYYSVKQNNINFYISKFIAMIEKFKVDFYGPIILNYRNFDDYTNIRVMVQCNTLENYKANFEFMENFTSKRCIFSSFSGNLNDLVFVLKKIDVYAYENDLFLDKETFFVIKDYNDEIFKIDVFKQIMVL